MENSYELNTNSNLSSQLSNVDKENEGPKDKSMWKIIADMVGNRKIVGERKRVKKNIWKRMFGAKVNRKK